MIQIEEEWMEYQNVMEEVITRSGLDRSIFFDLRGNHDKFGVPSVGGSFDYFSNYSISGKLGRNANVFSVTAQVSYYLLMRYVVSTCTCNIMVLISSSFYSLRRIRPLRS